ncbi:MAG TPA: condensation domain-containing protein, partial [Candidatus Dormibacteraeota bacterium]
MTAAAPDDPRRRLAALLGRQAEGGRGRTGPVSFAQRRQWIFDQLAPDTGEYNVWVALRAEQELDPAALGRALTGVVERHEVLRTAFPSLDGTPVQSVRGPSPVEVPVRDLSREPDPEAAARRVAREEAGRRLDLASGPLLRALLLHLGEGDQVLLLVTHHIVFDGWSAGILFRELDAGYAAAPGGGRPDLPDLPLQYVDFAVWQRRHLSGPLLDEQVDYWRRTLRGAPEALKLPQDYSRPPVRDVRGGSQRAVLDAGLVAGLQEIASAEGASLFVVLLAGFAALLARYSGQTDIAVGVPVSGRTRPELEHLIGFFVNTLVLRADVSGAPSFRELVGRVHEATVGAFSHQEVPFEKLVEELRPERDPALSPFFQAIYNYQVTPSDRLWLPNLRARLLPLDTGRVRFDLELNLFGIDDGVEGLWNYKQALFHPDTVGRMVGHYRRLLEGAAANPGRPLDAIPILGGGERQSLLGGGAPGAAAPPPSVADLVAERAARTPDAVAIEADGERLTYGRLLERAAGLEARLRAAGVGPESVVGVCLDRTPDLAAALLAVLRAGGAALPVAPASWPEWGPDALEAAGAAHLVAAEPPALAPPAGVTTLLLDGAEAPAGPVPKAPANAAALLLFRADARGEPLGAVIERGALDARLAGLRARHALEPGEGVLGVGPPSTEAGVWRLLWPLASGARVVAPDPAHALDAAHLAALVAGAGVGTLWVPPTLLRELLAAGLAEADLRRVLTTSEPLSVELVQR